MSDRSVSGRILRLVEGERDDVAAATPADRPELHAQPASIAPAIGSMLAGVHRLTAPVGEAPFDYGAHIRQRLESGRIVPAELPEPFDRYTAEDLVAIWTEHPAGERAPTVCLGRFEFGDIVVDGDRVVGLHRPMGILGNPDVDIAIAIAGVARHLGPEAVIGLIAAYGEAPDLVALDRGALAGHLLGWMPE